MYIYYNIRTKEIKMYSDDKITADNLAYIKIKRTKKLIDDLSDISKERKVKNNKINIK